MMKIRKRYFFYSTVFFFITFFLGFLYFQLIRKNVNFLEILNELTEKITDISITFSLTMLGFLIAAFSLLQLVQSKEWYEKIYKSVPFQSFLQRLWMSIIFVILNLVISIICIFIIKIVPDKCLIWVCCTMIGFLGYNISWIFACMVTYITIIGN